MEEWRDIDGYDGVYQVSSKGRIRSFQCNKCKILNCHIAGKTKHLKIGLYKDKKRKHYYVHEIVPLLEFRPYIYDTDYWKSVLSEKE